MSDINKVNGNRNSGVESITDAPKHLERIRAFRDETLAMLEEAMADELAKQAADSAPANGTSKPASEIAPANINEISHVNISELTLDVSSLENLPEIARVIKSYEDGLDMIVSKGSGTFNPSNPLALANREVKIRIAQLKSKMNWGMLSGHNTIAHFGEPKDDDIQLIISPLSKIKSVLSADTDLPIKKVPLNTEPMSAAFSGIYLYFWLLMVRDKNPSKAMHACINEALFSFTRGRSFDELRKAARQINAETKEEITKMYSNVTVLIPMLKQIDESFFPETALNANERNERTLLLLLMLVFEKISQSSLTEFDKESLFASAYKVISGKIMSVTDISMPQLPVSTLKPISERIHEPKRYPDARENIIFYDNAFEEFTKDIKAQESGLTTSEAFLGPLKLRKKNNIAWSSFLDEQLVATTVDTESTPSYKGSILMVPRNHPYNKMTTSITTFFNEEANILAIKPEKITREMAAIILAHALSTVTTNANRINNPQENTPNDIMVNAQLTELIMLDHITKGAFSNGINEIVYKHSLNTPEQAIRLLKSKVLLKYLYALDDKILPTALSKLEESARGTVFIAGLLIKIVDNGGAREQRGRAEYIRVLKLIRDLSNGS